MIKKKKTYKVKDQNVVKLNKYYNDLILKSDIIKNSNSVIDKLNKQQ